MNQSAFKKFDTVENMPWKTNNGTYLLYDFVHLLKNIRNLWLTEKHGQLEYNHGGDVKVAKWQDLCHLYEEESKSSKLLKMSSLTEVSVFPKPIERQRVSTCLCVFSERTVAALELFGKKHETDVTGTVLFISLVLKWWTILNVKRKGLDTRKNQSLQAVICDPEDSRLDFLLRIRQDVLRDGWKARSSC